MIYQCHPVESLNLNSRTHFSRYQWRRGAESIPVELATEMPGTDFEVGNIVEITVSRFEDNGRYSTLGIVIEEPES